METNYYCLSEEEIKEYKDKLDLGLYASLVPRENRVAITPEGKIYKIANDPTPFQVIDIYNDKFLNCCIVLLAADAKNKYNNNVDKVDFIAPLSEIEDLFFIQ